MSAKTKKQIVVEEAARLFRDKGYAAASIKNLADRVGLAKSSLYNHIKSKEDALQQICFHNANKFIAGIEEVEKTYNTPLDQLRALITFHVQTATNDITAVTVFNDEWRHLTEPHLGDFLALRKKYEDRFRKIIEEGIKQKTFKNVDPEIALQTILSALRWVYYYNKTDKKIDANKIQEQITMILLNGVKEK